MENLNENHEKDFSMEKAELENELTREIEDEIRNNDFLDKMIFKGIILYNTYIRPNKERIQDRYGCRSGR